MDCAIREVQEELLVTPLELTECGCLYFQFTDDYSIHVTVFRAADLEGQPTETEEAIPLWFKVDEIPYSEMWADDILWLPKLLAGEPIGGRFLFSDDRMIDYELD